MTVQELMVKLGQLPADAVVYVEGGAGMVPAEWVESDNTETVVIW